MQSLVAPRADPTARAPEYDSPGILNCFSAGRIASASEDPEESLAIPLHELPALPPRSMMFHIEPCFGTSFVLGMSALLVQGVLSTYIEQQSLGTLLKVLMFIYAAIAIL